MLEKSSSEFKRTLSILHSICFVCTNLWHHIFHLNGNRYTVNDSKVALLIKPLCLEMYGDDSEAERKAVTLDVWDVIHRRKSFSYITQRQHATLKSKTFIDLLFNLVSVSTYVQYVLFFQKRFCFSLWNSLWLNCCD